MADPNVALFRADGGPGYGGGHLMRCFALADAVRRRGVTPVLVTAQDVPSLLAAWRASDIDVDVTGCSAGTDSDENRTLQTAGRLNAGIAILDGYHFSPGYGHGLRNNGVTVVRFDDSSRPGRSVAADIVVNPNPYCGDDRHDAAVPSDCGAEPKLLQGGRYALIREEVRRARRTGGDGLLVTFGAQDDSNTGLSVASAFLSRDSETKVTLVCTADQSGYDEAAMLARAHPSRLRVVPSTDIVPLMARADFAVCPGGVTALELCALGIPFVSMPVAANQRPGVWAMAAAGATEAAETPEEAVGLAARLIADPEASQRLSIAARKLIDGKGADRLAAAICRVGSHVDC